MILTLDLETSTHNIGNPFDTRNFIVSAHIKCADKPVTAHFYDDPDFTTVLRDNCALASLLVGVNCKFDLSHLKRKEITLPDGCRVWDCMLAEFILSGQTSPFASLNQLAEKYGLGQKQNLVAEFWDKGFSTEDIPRDVVAEYGNHDVDLSYAVYLKQQTDPRMSPELHKLILLDGLDLLVLLDMECNGFKYDVAGSKARAETLLAELKDIDAELLSYSPHPINLESGDHLSCFLYGGSITEDVYLSEPAVYQSGAKKGQQYVKRSFSHTEAKLFPQLFVPLKGTALKKEGFYSTAEDTLIQLKAKTKVQRSIITLLNRRAYISKLCGTYLNAMPNLIEEMHWADNTIHGQFNQVVARTGRLSSSRPNMQNAPEDVDEFFVTRFAD
jgi:DNA polymerase I-like protein with 3'-5' exonuclease and polymerase domains